MVNNLDVNNTTDNDILQKALKIFSHAKKNLDNKNSKKYLLKTLNLLSQISEKTEQVNITEAECIKLMNNHKNIFELIAENDLNEIKSKKNIDFTELNNVGNTVLHHAVKIGDNEIIRELLKKGGKIDMPNGNGHTLLEFACLNKYINSIDFLIKHGASMEKHLYFRKNTKFYLNKPDIDLAILMKILLFKSKIKKNIVLFNFLEKYVNLNQLIGINDFKVINLILGLEALFENKSRYYTYRDILLEELEEYTKLNKTCCYDIIDIILVNLVPFINYPFNLSCDFIIKLELSFLIKSIMKNNKNNYKNIIFNKVYKDYITNNLFNEDYIGIQIFKILNKFKKK